MGEELIKPETGSKILNKPEILREESAVKPEPVKKGKGWIFRLILILIIIGVVLYLFMNPEIIMEPVNKFFGRFT